MRYLLLPVKDLTRGKSRLAPLLSREERIRLATAMMERTFAAAAGSKLADRTAVVTLYPPAIELATSYGMELIIEKDQTSESASVDFASGILGRRGAEAALRLPLDLPLVTPADIDSIFEQDSTGPSAVIVPSRDGTGTNAILRRPPDLFPSHFGPGSFDRHLKEAENCLAGCRILRSPNIALDIDGPDDLAEFLRLGCKSPLRELLETMNIEARIESEKREKRNKRK